MAQLEDPPFIGDWHREKRLGSGGFGVVTQWRNQKTQQTVGKLEEGGEIRITGFFEGRQNFLFESGSQKQGFGQVEQYFNEHLNDDDSFVNLI